MGEKSGQDRMALSDGWDAICADYGLSRAGGFCYNPAQGNCPGFVYLWSPRYIDSPVLRDHYDAEGELDASARVYYLGDANFNVTALVGLDNEEWTVTERYTYDPYGKALIYDADWANPTAPTAAGPLYAGYMFDPETGLYHVRHRYYHSTLSTWTTRDPLGYAAGDVNLYRYVANRPVAALDSFGLEGVVPVTWLLNRNDPKAEAEQRLQAYLEQKSREQLSTQMRFLLQTLHHRVPHSRYERLWVDTFAADQVFVGENEPNPDGYLNHAAHNYWWERRVGTISDLVAQIEDAFVRNGSREITVVIVAHGRPGAFGLDSWFDESDAVDLERYKPNFDALVGACRGRVSHLVISACDVAREDVGREFMETLAREARMLVTAPNALSFYHTGWNFLWMVYGSGGHSLPRYTYDCRHGWIKSGYFTVTPDGNWSPAIESAPDVLGPNPWSGTQVQ